LERKCSEEENLMKYRLENRRFGIGGWGGGGVK